MTAVKNIVWCLEKDLFGDRHSRLIAAIEDSGGKYLEWQDEWLLNGQIPKLADNKVVFHGSLGNASQIKEITSWNPGAFCNTKSFYCSAWYPLWQEHLVHQTWITSTVEELVNNPAVAKQIASNNTVFVRPDSPLKPFSGRVIKLKGLQLKDLDYGYYYSDRNLPIIIAPIVEITAEYRFVIVDNQVVAGSSYEPEGREEGVSLHSDNSAWQYAQSIVKKELAPEAVYILDIGKVGGDYCVLELNPFSGADLYSCNRKAIVTAIGELLS